LPKRKIHKPLEPGDNSEVYTSGVWLYMSIFGHCSGL